MTRVRKLSHLLFETFYKGSKSIIEESGHNKTLRAEVSRLSSLYYCLGQITGTDTMDLVSDTNPLFFNPSLYARTSGIEGPTVIAYAEHVLKRLDSEVNWIDFESMTISKVIDMMSIIHGIASGTITPDQMNMKRALGAYYTPIPVSDFIIEKAFGEEMQLINKGRMTVHELLDRMQQMTFLDPACGPGAFLQAIIRFAMKLQSSIGVVDSVILKRIRNNCYGVDLDLAALELTDVSLQLLSDSTQVSPSNSLLGNTLKQGNSLISSSLPESSLEDYFENPSSRLPFDWQSEFPIIFSKEKHGFDLIAFNPPYERLKPNKVEFGRHRKSARRPDMASSVYEQHLKTLEEDVNYFRNSGVYPLSGIYSINTYRLFMERALSLTRRNGRIAFIVPSTIIADYSAHKLRQEILTSNQLESLFEFSESAALFPDVVQSLCIGVVRRNNETGFLNASFLLDSIDDGKLLSPVRIPISKICAITGQSMAIPKVRKEDWVILDRMHKHQSIRNNPNITNYRGEVDLTLDRELISERDEGIPLVRGANLLRYRLDLQRGKNSLQYVDIERLIEKKPSSIRVNHHENYRIACQQVSNQMQRWRLKFTYIEPDHVLANSCNYIILKNHDSMFYNYLLGLLNSDLLNWRFSVTNANNHVSNREIDQLPIPDFSSKDETSEFAYMISKEVRSLMKEESNDTSRIEALVFKLYSIPYSKGRRILKHQRSSRKYQSEVKTHYSEL